MNKRETHMPRGSLAGATGGGGTSPTLRELLPRCLPQIEGYVRTHLGRTLRDRESASDLVDSVCGDLLAENIAFEYRGEGEFQSWLRSVVVNKIRGRLRFVRAKKRGHDREVVADDSRVEAAHVDLASPSHDAMMREDLGLLDRALARLPEHYRDLIVRVHLRGEPRESVVASLESTADAMRGMLTRAMVKLAGELDRLQSR